MGPTRQGDPSTPGGPGAGYKATMVAMDGQAFHTFPLILVPLQCVADASTSVQRPYLFVALVD